MHSPNGSQTCLYCSQKLTQRRLLSVRAQQATWTSELQRLPLHPLWYSKTATYPQDILLRKELCRKESRPDSLSTKREAFLRQRKLLSHSPNLTPITVVVINYLSKTHSGERGWGKPQWQRSRSLGPLVTVPLPTRSRRRRPWLFAYAML